MPRSSTSGPKDQRKTQRYLVGLSCGPSSTALLHVLTENVRQQRARGRKTARFEYVAAHVVDDTLSPPPPPSSSVSPSSSSSTAPEEEKEENPAIAAYRTRFPSAPLLTVPLSSALALPSIDWSSLPSPSTTLPSDDPTRLPPAHRLSSILHQLPSATSRADVRRLLTRHVLLALARSQNCDALLLGHSTTSLAELTLSETAKGRGHSVPWLVNDGAVPAPVPRSLPSPLDAGGFADGGSSDAGASDPSGGSPALSQLLVYSPLRELFRRELLTYLSQTDPPLTDLIITSSSSTTGAGSGGAVVSHRDQSIDDVLSRYFADVETGYPSVVANVVRTTGKLRRPPPAPGGDGRGHCGLCGAGLDELGDERWRGEIGDNDTAEATEAEAREGKKKPMLCYGCERSVRG